MRRVRAISLGLAVAVVAPFAHADPDAGADPPANPNPNANPNPAPVLVPPRVVASENAAYPEGATTEAHVLVELIVGVDGLPSDVHALSGSEPFIAAAIAAISKYRFEPATRAGKPVRARIRIEVSFTPPPKEEGPLPVAPSAASEPKKPSEPPKVVETQEVTVRGARSPVSSPTETKIGRAQIRVIPGAFGDPYRAIDILPGVVPIVSGLPYYFIRGAPPSAVGYFVEEVRVPYLFHFGLGPGVVQPALIEEVSLHPAAFPARYGRFAGAIVAGQLRQPPTELRGEAQIRIYDAGAYVEAPFADGRATAGVGGRYSYTAGILSLFVPNVTIDYRDYNARVSYALSDKVRLSAFALGSFDFTSSVEDGVEQVLFASEFHRLDLRLDRATADSTSRVAITLGLDRTRLADARFAQNRLLGLRARHRARVNDNIDVEVGADTLAEFYAGDLPSPYAVSRSAYREAELFFSPRLDSSTGAWLSASYHPAQGWDLTAAFRGDVFTSDGNIAFGPSPRLSMRVPLRSNIAFLAALGIAPQPPAFAIPVPAVGYRGLPGGLAYGYQKSAGFDFELPYRFSLRTVGFHHTYANLRDFTRNRADADVADVASPSGAPAQAYGLELFLNRKLSDRYSAFVSYTLSRSTLGSTRVDPAQVAPFDRTHVLHVGGAVDLGANWLASARFLTYTGWPILSSDRSNIENGAPPRTESSGRLPAFMRLDLRLEKRWNLRKAGHVSFVMEGLNVTGTRDVVNTRCSPAGCRDTYFGPVIVPSIGVEGAL